ncbi:multicopper oxidase domain-containing protein [Effusibacillus lacus]|uniref:Copper-containing nitrite reductase n=1 Tax=Effusibacillus lacus TaxID=1348429 RepID=A0A292YJE4_9BACL|nr:multicopper oxidase domain-containing protein [Effusibacillus lacus]GAX88504.1 nitrite reductase [Effusibacillus lacus]
MKALALLILTGALLAGCSAQTGDTNVAQSNQNSKPAPTNMNLHEGINQPPVPVIVKRTGDHEVYVEMTSQITDLEIAPGVKYKAWTFNGTAPGPVIKVKEGDTIKFKMKNLDPKVPHSMDFHAVHASPSKDFADIHPNEEGVFTYPAMTPGVFMYHCGTKPVLLHIANGMYGTIIVEPKDGYPTDKEINREFIITQSEFYKENDLNDMTNGVPSYVLFNGKHPDLSKPFYAKVGDKVRIYFNNVGPNEVSSFHVVGTTFDTVYVDGNPKNVLNGLQAYTVPASGGLVVEFRVLKEGTYPIVTHQFNHVQKGALAKLIVTADGNPPQTADKSSH